VDVINGWPLTLAVHSRRKDETTRKGTGHQPSYAEAEKKEVANTSIPRHSTL